MMYPLKFEVILKSILWGGSEICKFKNLSTKLDGIGESWERTMSQLLQMESIKGKI